MSDLNKIPQELQNTDSVLWRLLMCLSEGSLDVLLVCPFGNCRVAARHYDLDRSDYLKSLQDVMFRNQWLLSEFGRSAVIMPSRRMMMTPPAIGDQTMLSMLGVLWPDDDFNLCADRIGGGMGTLVSGVDASLLAYVQRTFPTMAVHHRLLPLLTYCCAKSRADEQVKLYASVTDNTVDIIYISDDKIRAVNTYDISGADDVVYYVLMVARTYRFDKDNDAVVVLGNEAVRQQVTDQLTPHIGDIRQPSLYQLASTYQFRDLPTDLILMPICV